MYTFGKIKGNEIVKNYLKNIIKANKIPHAFIIDGQQGSGKKLIAYTFSKAIECNGDGTGNGSGSGNSTGNTPVEPCNKCQSCITFDSQNHADVFFVKSTNKKSYGVSDIRDQINNTVYILPYKHKYKVFIINNADTMTPQAQNALLKTIEEPPEYAVFILISENLGNFLPTILSRCVVLKTKPLANNKVKDFLVSEGNVEKDKAEIISSFSEGYIGKALNLITDEDFISLRESVISLSMKIKDADLLGVFKLALEISEYKDKIKEVLDIMYLWFRDILVYKETSNEAWVFDKSNIQLIKIESENFTNKSLLACLENISKTKFNLTYNSNFQLTIEVMLLNIKEFD